jgi:hypothetical protein
MFLSRMEEFASPHVAGWLSSREGTASGIPLKGVRTKLSIPGLFNDAFSTA